MAEAVRWFTNKGAGGTIICLKGRNDFFSDCQGLILTSYLPKEETTKVNYYSDIFAGSHQKQLAKCRMGKLRSQPLFQQDKTRRRTAKNTQIVLADLK